MRAMFLAYRSSSMSCAAVLVALLVSGCPGGDGSTTGGATTTGTTASSESQATATGVTTSGASEPTTTGTTGASATDPTTAADPTGDSSTSGFIPIPPACEDSPPAACDEEITNCKSDEDGDWVHFSCDNAPYHNNPQQLDMDGDGFGDVVDTCPTVATESNAADSDRDGVGNACDVCALSPNTYNKGVASVPFYMRVRRIPDQGDADHDGVGDACDNCVRVANCHNFGEGPGLEPHVVGMPTDVMAPDCQADANDDLVGDACAGMMLPGAAGPVGFLDDDDFDQDGLINIEDACPRQPVARRTCEGPGDCPSGAACSASGICNHADHDGDGVGDICDTCPYAANPEQITEAGAALDDADNDFVGAACEQTPDCDAHANARPFAFYDVSVNGVCCVTTYDGHPLLDPDGNPIDVADLPPLPPGMVELPPGCEEALAASEDGKAHAIKACHVDTPSDLWPYLCFLPVWDQEFDGVPDACDLCPFAYDPSNATYVDQDDMEWPNNGKYCNGEYSASLLDPATMCKP